MTRPALLRPSRWPALLQDLSALAVLAFVAAALGLYARGGRAASPAAAAEAIAHPVLGLAEFRAHVEARTALVLDARPTSAYAAGHVPGALSLPVDDFDAAYARLAARLASRPERLLVVYCSDLWCSLGDELQQRLVSRGFAPVGNFRDGWAAWRDARLPEQSAAPAPAP